MLNVRTFPWSGCLRLLSAAVFLNAACTVTFQADDPPAADDAGGEGEGEGDGDAGAVGVSGTALVVAATWGDAAADVDLHLTQLNVDNTACVQALPVGIALPGAVARSCEGTQDCSWQTCTSADTATVEWDGLAGHSAGDPLLDLGVDNLGPSVASVAALGPGRTLVSLVGFTAQSTTQATVRLYANGLLSAELVVPVSGLALTEVALVVQRSSGAVCIEDLTDGDSSDDCGV